MAGLVEKLKEEIGRLRAVAAEYPELAAQFGAAGVVADATQALAAYSTGTPSDTDVSNTITAVVTTRYQIENRAPKASPWLTVLAVGAIGAGIWWLYRERE